MNSSIDQPNMVFGLCLPITNQVHGVFIFCQSSACVVPNILFSVDIG